MTLTDTPYRQVEVSAGGASSEEPANTTSVGCGQGRSRRPPDSFARVRNAARWNAANPPGKGLEGRFKSKAAREAFAFAACGYSHPWRSWTNEPELQGMDDGLPHWVERTKATGNTILPQIPEMIGRAILEAMQ